MIYLIQLDNAYKIGYSDNIKDRINHLSKTHLDVKIISLREGDKKHEQLLHNACKEFHIKNELFKIDKLVIEIFKTYEFTTPSTSKINTLTSEINIIKSEIIKLRKEIDSSIELTNLLIKVVTVLKENAELKQNINNDLIIS